MSGWDGSVVAVEHYLKPRMNDPDSLEMAACSDPVVDGPYWKAACTYRGKNAFGAVILNGGIFYIQAGGYAGESVVVKSQDVQ